VTSSKGSKETQSPSVVTTGGAVATVTKEASLVGGGGSIEVRWGWGGMVLLAVGVWGVL
jgi:hypothetical protein